jgi:HEAT repeat protein
MRKIIRSKAKFILCVGLLVLAVTAILALVLWRAEPEESGPLVAGRPVSHWIRTLPQEADTGFVDYNHPLEQAGPEIIPSLINVLELDRERRAFYRKLLRFVPPPLSRGLPPPDAPIHRIHTFAAFRLGQFGPEASNAVPALIRYYSRKTNSFALDRVVQALGKIGPASEPAVPVLIEAFSNPRVPENWVTTSLLQIGKIPPEAIRHLERQIASGQGHIAGQAAVAMWVGKRDAESLERVHEFLQSTNKSLRAYTAVSLSYQREFPAETKRLLQTLLEDSERGVPQAAAIALAYAGERSELLISVLIEGLKAGEFTIPCALALAHIGPDAKEAVPELKANFDPASPALCRAFLKAIEEISGAPAATGD